MSSIHQLLPDVPHYMEQAGVAAGHVVGSTVNVLKHPVGFSLGIFNELANFSHLSNFQDSFIRTVHLDGGVPTETAAKIVDTLEVGVPAGLITAYKVADYKTRLWATETLRQSQKAVYDFARTFSNDIEQFLLTPVRFMERLFSGSKPGK